MSIKSILLAAITAITVSGLGLSAQGARLGGMLGAAIPVGYELDASVYTGPCAYFCLEGSLSYNTALRSSIGYTRFTDKKYEYNSSADAKVGVEALEVAAEYVIRATDFRNGLYLFTGSGFTVANLMTTKWQMSEDGFSYAPKVTETKRSLIYSFGIGFDFDYYIGLEARYVVPISLVFDSSPPRANYSRLQVGLRWRL
jgi:hypothetical protein